MNFSPDNRMTLEALLAGLGAGVSGEQAAPILAATLNAQAAQTAQRKAEYQDMAANVASMAGQGLPYGAVENYVDTMTRKPGVPGRFQELITSAFENPDIPAQFQRGGEQYMQPGEWNTADTADVVPGAYGIPASQQMQLQSPLYTQNPASTGAYNMNPGPNQGNLMTPQGQANYAAMGELMANQPSTQPSDADMMGQVNAQINAMKAAQMSPEEIVARIATAPDVQGIIMDNFQEFAQVQPDIIQLMAPGAGV